MTVNGEVVYEEIKDWVQQSTPMGSHRSGNASSGSVSDVMTSTVMQSDDNDVEDVDEYVDMTSFLGTKTRQNGE